jgi:hypothetical protein
MSKPGCGGPAAPEVLRFGVGCSSIFVYVSTIGLVSYGDGSKARCWWAWCVHSHR